MSFDLILFGGTGDLVWRKIMPALFQAFSPRPLPAGGRIVGVARDDSSDDQYRALIKSRFDSVELAKRPSDGRVRALRRAAGLPAHGLVQPGRLRRAWPPNCSSAPADVVVMYVATAPSLFTTVCEQIAAAGLNGPQTRVVLEKPLGHDLASNRAINNTVRSVLSEQQIFRIDHYLGKPSVQNLFALRFGNSLFEPLWRRETHRQHPDHHRRGPGRGKARRRSTTARARCATWCRTTRCNCCAPSAWSRPSTRMPTPSATRSSRCCAR